MDVLTEYQTFAVTETSAVLQGHHFEGLPVDHFELNRFDGPDDGNFRKVARELKKMAKIAATFVEERPESQN